MSSNFLQSMAVLEGARAALRVGAVSKGERVGFICDLRVEPDVIYAFFTAAGEIGATAFLWYSSNSRLIFFSSTVLPIHHQRAQGFAC